MSDTPRRQGPITWTRPPGESDATHIAATVYDVDGGVRIVVDVEGTELEATLVDEPPARPAVLRLDGTVRIDGATVEAIRLPSGTDDAITDAVRAFGSE